MEINGTMKCFSNFPILRQRYTRGFFTGFLNEYFILLTYFSISAGIDFEMLLSEIFQVLFTRNMSILNKYDGDILYKQLIRKQPPGKKQKEECFLMTKSNKLLLMTLVFVAVKNQKLLDKKRSELCRFNNLLFIMELGVPDFIPNVRIWKTRKKSFLYACQVKDLRKDVTRNGNRLLLRLELAEKGKILTPFYISELKSYNTFLYRFYQETDNCMSGKICAIINKFYNQYLEELDWVSEIRGLITEGVI